MSFLVPAALSIAGWRRVSSPAVKMFRPFTSTTTVTTTTVTATTNTAVGSLK